MSWLVFAASLFGAIDEKMFEFTRPPEEVLGIESVEVNEVGEEKIIKTCREGADEMVVRQTREVVVEPGREVSMERYCIGHEEEFPIYDKKRIWFDSYDTAEKHKRAVEVRLAADPNISHYAVINPKNKKDGPPYRVKIKYWHKPGSLACSRCEYQKKEADAPMAGRPVKRCKGHGKQDSAQTHTFDKAREQQRAQERQFQADRSIAAFRVSLGQHGDMDGKYRLDKEWRHADDHPLCDHYIVDHTTKYPAVEKSDRWLGSEKLAKLEADPRCKMIRIKNGDPATKNINGLAVHRDAWDREIVLECGIDSECGSLQRAGGVLVKKECVSADGEGRCLVWEKSYDFGKKPSYVAVKRKFKEGEKIWGLNGEFDDYKQNYDKRSDFPQMAAALSSLVGMYRPDQEISEESLNNPDLPQLYPGEARSCHCNLQSASPFDCCEKTSTDVRCSAKELETAGERDSGRCHWIGMRRDAEGNTEQIYCCFGSKIARIIQEQAHQKLSIGWGSTEDPLCRGLTQKEYGKLASGKIDLSEAYDDYPASGDEMAKSLQEKIRAHLERNSP